MPLTVKRNAIYRVLQKLVKLVERNNTAEELHCVALRAAKGVLSLQTVGGIGNTKRTLSATVKASGSLIVGIKCHDLTALLKCKASDDADVVFGEPLDRRITVKFDGYEVVLDCWTVGSLELAWPGIAEKKIIKRSAKAWEPLEWVEAETFVERLDYVLPAVSDDEVRPHINVVCFEKGRMIATDGHRMHLTALLETRKHKTFLLPRETARILRCLMVGSNRVQIKLHTKEDYIQFVVTSGRRGQVDWEYTCQLAEASFPPHDQVVPKESSGSVTVNGFELQKILRQISQVVSSNDASLVMVFSTSNKRQSITLTGQQIGVASIDFKLTVSGMEGIEDGFQFGVSNQYLIQALKTNTSQAKLLFNGKLDPLLIESGDQIAVVMPRRV